MDAVVFSGDNKVVTMLRELPRQLSGYPAETRPNLQRAA
jgi:hypothetical protein